MAVSFVTSDSFEKSLQDLLNYINLEEMQHLLIEHILPLLIGDGILVEECEFCIERIINKKCCYFYSLMQLLALSDNAKYEFPGDYSNFSKKKLLVTGLFSSFSRFRGFKMGKSGTNKDLLIKLFTETRQYTVPYYYLGLMLLEKRDITYYKKFIEEKILDLSNNTFSYCKFKRSEENRISFTNIILNNCNLSYTEWENIEMDSIDIQKSDLSFSEISDCFIKNCNLSGTDMFYTKMSVLTPVENCKNTENIVWTVYNTDRLKNFVYFLNGIDELD